MIIISSSIIIIIIIITIKNRLLKDIYNLISMWRVMTTWRQFHFINWK